jgi:hypothetical protein
VIEQSGGRQEELMSSFSEQDPLNPNDPEFYAPLRLRERAAKLGLSLSRAARSEPIGSSPISLPASLDIQPKNEVSDALWKPLAPEVINEPARLARERRTAQLGVAAAAAGVVTVVVLLFVIMKPAPRQSDAGSTSSEITGSTSTALPQSFQADVGSKPALAEFQALIASVLSSQPATHEQSQQLLQQFLQWRKKADATEKFQ